MKTQLVKILVTCGMLCAVTAAKQAAAGPPFVPNSQSFWDSSQNWTTNYGPAYRDTVLAPTNFLECTGQFALCFHSGPEPLPCKLSKDGRFANCTCDVLDGTNYVLSTAILNHEVYLDTIDSSACGPDGANCRNIEDPNPKKPVAPVCDLLGKGQLMPGAQVISTYDPETTRDVQGQDTTKTVTPCSAAPGDPPLPFAGCMTASCKLNKDGTTAQCDCPVFYGDFQLVSDVGEPAQCTLGGGLVPSASYNPKLDPNVPVPQ